LHIINTDVGFAGMQGMGKDSVGVTGANYDAFLKAGITRDEITWDYYDGCPH